MKICPGSLFQCFRYRLRCKLFSIWKRKQTNFPEFPFWALFALENTKNHAGYLQDSPWDTFKIVLDNSRIHSLLSLTLTYYGWNMYVQLVESSMKFKSIFIFSCSNATAKKCFLAKRISWSHGTCLRKVRREVNVWVIFKVLWSFCNQSFLHQLNNYFQTSMNQAYLFNISHST